MHVYWVSCYYFINVSTQNLETTKVLRPHYQCARLYPLSHPPSPRRTAAGVLRIWEHFRESGQEEEEEVDDILGRVNYGWRVWWRLLSILWQELFQVDPVVLSALDPVRVEEECVPPHPLQVRVVAHEVAQRPRRHGVQLRMRHPQRPAGLVLQGVEEPVPELDGLELPGNQAAEGGAHHRVRVRGLR